MKRFVLILAATSVAGCAANSSAVRPLRPLEIALAQYQDDASAQMTGTFMYESSCLLFRDEDSRQITQPVFPYGTIFNGTSIIFHLPGKAEARVVIGEEVRISGKPLDWQGLAGPSYAPFREQCVSAPFFVSAVRPAN